MPRALWWSWGAAVSYERGTLVGRVGPPARIQVLGALRATVGNAVGLTILD